MQPVSRRILLAGAVAVAVERLLVTGQDSQGNVAAATCDVTVDDGAPSATFDFVIGANADYLRSLSRTGPAWQRVLDQANAAYGFDPQSNTPDGSGNAFAGGLVYVATESTAYRDKVNAALDAVQAHGPTNWFHAAANRKGNGWILAANLVGRPVRTTSADLTPWGQFLSDFVRVQHSGNGRAGIIGQASWQWDNNHGSAARKTYIAAMAALGLRNTTINGQPGGVEPFWEWMKAWLGGTHPGFAYSGTDTSTSYGTMGATEPALSGTWQHPGHPAGIVPSSTWAGAAVDSRRESAIPSEYIRENGSFPTIGTSAGNYIFGNAGRMTEAAVVVAAMGHPEVWQYADQALRRWRQAAYDRGFVMPEGAQNQQSDSILNGVYGTSFPAVSSVAEGITGGDWLASGGQWPIT